MDDRQPDSHIARLIASIAARSDAQTRDLVASLTRRCWPARGSDRAEPVASEWLRRWAPKPVALPPLACSCAVGRCPVCN